MLNLIAALAFAVPASAGLEQAASAAGKVFQSFSFSPKFAHARSLNDEDSLIELLDDRDASVRASAARSLKTYAPNSYRAENALLERANDRREVETVRREAIKSLSWAAQHWNTRDALIRLAKDSWETASLRAIAYKSLYVIAADWTVQRALFDALDRGKPLAIRAAAAWALGGSSATDNQAREKLRDLARDGGEPLALRIEAVKSLYPAMGNWNARDVVLDLAKSEQLPVELRQTAILALNAINQDWNVRDYLRDEAQRERNGVLRNAAIRALSNGPDFELVIFFHLSHYMDRFVDPLESQ